MYTNLRKQARLRNLTPLANRPSVPIPITPSPLTVTQPKPPPENSFNSPYIIEQPKFIGLKSKISTHRRFNSVLRNNGNTQQQITYYKPYYETTKKKPENKSFTDIKLPTEINYHRPTLLTISVYFNVNVYKKANNNSNENDN